MRTSNLRRVDRLRIEHRSGEIDSLELARMLVGSVHDEWISGGFQYRISREGPAFMVHVVRSEYSETDMARGIADTLGARFDVTAIYDGGTTVAIPVDEIEAGVATITGEEVA